VVTSAQFMLDSESKLREAIAKMLEPKQEPAPAAMQEQGDMKMDDLFSDDKQQSQPKAGEKLDDLFK